MLPLFDTPSHLALVRAWHSHSDPAYALMQHYSVSVEPVPYLFYYGFVHLLMYVAPIEIAHKLVLSVYLVAFPLSVAFLARSASRSPWLALLVFPLAYNRSWGYGFIAYLLGIVCGIVAFAFLIRYTRSGLRRDLLGFGLAITTTYFFHILPWAVFGLASALALPVARTPWKRSALAMGSTLPGVGALVWNAIFSAEGRSKFFDESQTPSTPGDWHDWRTRFAEFVQWCNDIVQGPMDTIVFAMLGVTVLVFFALAWRYRSPQPSETRVATRMLVVLLVCTAAACFLLPFSLYDPVLIWALAPRLAPLFVVALVVLPVVEVCGVRAVFMVPLAIANLLLLIQVSSLYRDFSRRNVSVLRMCDTLPRGKTVLVLMRGRTVETDIVTPLDPVASLPAYRHFRSWPMALLGGHSDRPFYQGIPVRPHVKYPSRDDNPNAYSLALGPYYDYYIVRGLAPDFDSSSVVTRITTRGQWSLYAHNVKN